MPSNVSIQLWRRSAVATAEVYRLIITVIKYQTRLLKHITAQPHLHTSKPLLMPCKSNAMLHVTLVTEDGRRKRKRKSKGVFMKMTLARRVEKKTAACRSPVYVFLCCVKKKKKKTELQSYSAIYLVNSLNVGSISNVTTSTKSPTFKWLCVL